MPGENNAGGAGTPAGGTPAQGGQGQGGTPGQGQAGGQQGNQQPGGQPGSQQAAPLQFDEWIQAQPPEVRAAYEQHTTGLRNTVQATRQERDDLSAQLGKLTTALGKKDAGEAQRLVEQMTQDLEAANRRAAFAEEAGRPEIGCRNAKAAYALAMAENLFDRRGNPDWNALKQAAPELFGAAAGATRSNAGAGTSSQPAAGGGMNEFIRKAAGRQ